MYTLSHGSAHWGSLTASGALLVCSTFTAMQSRGERLSFYNPLKRKGSFQCTSVLSSYQNKGNSFCLLGFYFCFFYGRVSYSPGLFWTCHVADNDLELLINQLLPLKSWDHRHTLLRPSQDASPCLHHHLARVTKWSLIIVCLFVLGILSILPTSTLFIMHAFQ